MTTRFRMPVIAIVVLIGLTSAAALGQDEEQTAAVELKIIQVNPDKPDGASTLAAWDKLVAELHKSAAGEGDRSEPAADDAVRSAPGGATCEVIACDSAKLFGTALTAAAAQESADDEAAYKVLTAPRVILNIGKQANISVGRDVPYMVKRDDGSLIVERSGDLFEGVAADMKVSEPTPRGPNADATFLTDLHVRISRVSSRDQIEGVPFEVGHPTITVQEISSTLRMAERQDVIVRLPQGDGDQQPIFVIARVYGLEKK